MKTILLLTLLCVSIQSAALLAVEDPKATAVDPPKASVAEPKAPPINVEVDSTGVPEMKEWTDKAAKVTVDFYPRILQELGVEGYKKPEKVRIYVKPDMKGVAYANGSTITIAPAWFKANPNDVGAVVHEMCHVVQQYGGKRVPSWVTEGVADYVRWFVYEPVNKRPRVRNPDKAKHTDSYQTTAAFFDWIVRTHDKEFVKKLNLACRGGKYSEEFFKEQTKKTVEELWTDFVAYVKKPATAEKQTPEATKAPQLKDVGK